VSKNDWFGVVVIGLLGGQQRASADVVYACVNKTNRTLLYIVSATTIATPQFRLHLEKSTGMRQPVVRLQRSYTPNVATHRSPRFCSVVNVSAQQRTVTYSSRFDNKRQYSVLKPQQCPPVREWKSFWRRMTGGTSYGTFT